jgi:hypothetical protein
MAHRFAVIVRTLQFASPDCANSGVQRPTPPGWGGGSEHSVTTGAQFSQNTPFGCTSVQLFERVQLKLGKKIVMTRDE